MTDNQTMSKPREVTIRRFKLLADSEQEMSVATKGQLEYQHLDVNFEYIPMIEKCAYEALKIDNNSWQNCQRKLNEANERIVEFESIKSGHLKIQEEMQKQLEAAKKEAEDYNDSNKILSGFLRDAQKELAAEKQRSAKAYKLLKYYTENCELIIYDQIGGDGAPVGYVPFPMEWTEANKLLAEYSAGNESSKGDGNA